MDRHELRQITSHALRRLTPSSVEILSYDEEERIARVRIISDSFANTPSKVQRFEALAHLTSDDEKASKITFIFEAWTRAEFDEIFAGENVETEESNFATPKVAARGFEIDRS